MIACKFIIIIIIIYKIEGKKIIRESTNAFTGYGHELHIIVIVKALVVTIGLKLLF